MKYIKKTAIVILIGIIIYLGAGEEYIAQGINYVGNKITEWIAAEKIDNNIEEGRIAGKVTRVSDGDTFMFRENDGESIKVRLNGIDCPEIGQDYGDEAREFVQSLVANKHATLSTIDVDQYDRVLGVLYVGKQNINEELLRNGLAWQYRFDKNKKYKQLVDEAKANKLNIWSSWEPEDPYVWRKKNGNRQ